MENLINILRLLRQDYDHISFVAGSIAQWSPANKKIVYVPTEETADLWSLLHELGHAILGHNTYKTDINLLQKETAAWEAAKKAAQNYAVVIDEDYIQNCLDTYRDWLHKRSACPRCGYHGVQSSERLYSCINCRSIWQVSASRFCRPYRLRNKI